LQFCDAVSYKSAVISGNSRPQNELRSTRRHFMTLVSESSRRAFLRRLGLASAGSAALSVLGRDSLATPLASVQKDDETPSAAADKKIWSNEYWAQRGNLKLNLFRKRRNAPHSREGTEPVLFLVHGSSISSRSSFDLSVPGHGEYSIMNKFAEYGFDVWTMDFAGYGRSPACDGNSNIADGVQDLRAAVEVVARETGQQRYHFFGESSGALRAGAYAMDQPQRVNRLILTALTYTGEGSPTLADRAKQLEFYRNHNRRPRDSAMIHSIFTRDKSGTSDPAVGDALADAELRFGASVPTGTYLDMTANLPVIDPQKIHAPVLVARGEYDGIATDEDCLNFYRKLPNSDRQFVILPGMAHSLVLGLNRHQLWHVARSFLEMPPRLDSLKA
jgi:alpha-beta hydrolase superfamily lysophospholipase